MLPQRVYYTIQVESKTIGQTAPKPDFLDEAEQGDGHLKEEGEAKSGGSDEVRVDNKVQDTFRITPSQVGHDVLQRRMDCVF